MIKVFKLINKIYIIAVLIIIAFSAYGFLENKTLDTPNLISGVIVPHHNIASGQRANFFSELAKSIDEHNFPKTIILVSPNHYSTGRADIQTTDKKWEINTGYIESNKFVVSELVKNKVASNEIVSFANEHGIYNILSDIKKTFPKADIVPIVIKSVGIGELNKLNDSLYKSCKQCLMIASVDFSHYQPANLGNLHDEKSIRELQTLNTLQLLNNVEVDSGSTLALLSLWAKKNNTSSFNLSNHTNSSLLLNEPDLEGTSHLFGWYATGPTVEPKKFVSFVITNEKEVGVENRSIWGTDLVISEPILGLNHTLIAGKVTEDYLEVFAVPFSTSKPFIPIAGTQKQDKLAEFYKPYRSFIETSEAGEYIKIPFTSKISFESLSYEQIKSKIELTINLNP